MKVWWKDLKWQSDQNGSDVETVAPRRDSQRAPETMGVIGKDVWRSGIAACLERTRNDNVGIEPFVN